MHDVFSRHMFVYKMAKIRSTRDEYRRQYCNMLDTLLFILTIITVVWMIFTWKQEQHHRNYDQ